MKIASIASGSSGNCIYVGTNDTHLLVDAGVSCKKIEEGLAGFGISPTDVSGVLITHEHSDHIKGIGVFVKKYKVPLYGTIETLAAIKRTTSGKGIPMEVLQAVRPETHFMIGDIGIRVTDISHDAAHPVCYGFEADGRYVSMATDLGTYNERIINHLSNADIIYIESNYDPEMLMVGNYPYYLKQRIDGERGHLSNEMSAELVSKILHPGLKHIILAHLSHENNFPEIAYQTYKNMIDEKWNFEEAKPTIDVAKRDVPSISYSLMEDEYYEENDNNCCG